MAKTSLQTIEPQTPPGASPAGGSVAGSEHTGNRYMPFAAAIGLLAVLASVVLARHWPFINDGPLIHYVIFLMDHGRAPYRDIIEMNMPGTYMLDWSVVHALGGGAFGWWVWDVLSGIVAIVASAWIAGPGKRAAGIAAGSLAYLIHLADGPKDLGQRDWMVAVMLLVAFGCLFTAIRKGRPIWMAGFMGLCALAATIKPPVIGIGVAFLVATCWLEWKRPSGEAARPRYLSLVLWSLAGGVIPAVLCVAFLVHWNVTKEFSDILHGLVPYYATLDRRGYWLLITRAPGVPLLPLFAGAFAIFLLGRFWRSWEDSFLLAATLSGALLFVIQGKGWNYHRYPEIALGALWGIFELDRALRVTKPGGKKPQRLIALATLAVVTLGVTPWLFSLVARKGTDISGITTLEADLNRLGGARLSGHVQCLDMTNASCINVLYRMKLLQSTGFIYDFYLFPRPANPVSRQLQERFLAEVAARPPEVIILSAHTWPEDIYSYDQVNNFRGFREWLERNYRLDREEPSAPHKAGYRLYVLDRKVAALARQVHAGIAP